MSEKLSCHVVRDLLPLYADGLTEEETAEDIRDHLAGCSDCSSLYNAMKEGEPREQKDRENKEIDYLKKVKKRRKIPAIIIGIAAVAVIALLIIRVFAVGMTAHRLMMEADVQRNTITIRAESLSSEMAISSISFTEKDETVIVEGKTVLALIKKSGEKTVSYEAKNSFKKIETSDGTVLWEDGQKISQYANLVYSLRTEYIGNNSAVGNLLAGAGISNRLGRPFTMELITGARPYGLRLITEGSNETYFAKRDRFMDYACVILASIDNLEYVEYSFGKTENDVNIRPVPNPYRITIEDANNYIREECSKRGIDYSDVKTLGKSAKGINTLMELFEIDWLYDANL